MRNTNGDQLKEIFLFNITQRYKKKKKVICSNGQCILKISYTY